MKKRIYQIVALLIAVSLCYGCSSGGSSAKRPQLNADFSQQQASTFSFSAGPSETLHLSERGASSVLAAVSQVQTEYPYQELYQLEEVKRRLDFDTTVADHQFSALNTDGKLEVSCLAAVVRENNDAFLATKPFGYKSVEEDYISDLCDFIVKTVNTMVEKYPDIDWPRVYCNLGNLKILYDTGMLSYAEVSPEMILSISKNNTQIVLTMKGQDGFSRVLTHEIMHIIQIGCACEQIENCGRRAGIAVYWDDFTMNTTDWTWMVEGSAERQMCSTRLILWVTVQ